MPGRITVDRAACSAGRAGSDLDRVRAGQRGHADARSSAQSAGDVRVAPRAKAAKAAGSAVRAGRRGRWQCDRSSRVGACGLVAARTRRARWRKRAGARDVRKQCVEDHFHGHGSEGWRVCGDKLHARARCPGLRNPKASLVPEDTHDGLQRRSPGLKLHAHSVNGMLFHELIGCQTPDPWLLGAPSRLLAQRAASWGTCDRPRPRCSGGTACERAGLTHDSR